jgi:hypothetical protein|nr:MAG TPA: hypothetical protein [Caudoviricetes sp.]
MKAWEVHYLDSDNVQHMEIIASARKPSSKRALKLAGIDQENINLSEVIVQELVIYGEHGNQYIAQLKEYYD